MYGYSITVRMHLAPLAVVFELFYYGILLYAGLASAKWKGNYKRHTWLLIGPLCPRLPRRKAGATVGARALSNRLSLLGNPL